MKKTFSWLITTNKDIREKLKEAGISPEEIAQEVSKNKGKKKHFINIDIKIMKDKEFKQILANILTAKAQ